jgi:hypothetical protein
MSIMRGLRPPRRGQALTDDIPRVSNDHPHVWTEQERERIASYLEQIAQQIRAGVFGTVPPGMVAVTTMGEPVPGMHMQVTCTRPGPV